MYNQQEEMKTAILQQKSEFSLFKKCIKNLIH
jgi:hypothetical protein